MTEQYAGWAEEFVGERLDAKLALSRGWHDQGSENFHFGAPARKGLWVKSISPTHSCGHMKILIFLFMISCFILDESAADTTGIAALQQSALSSRGRRRFPGLAADGLGTEKTHG